MREVCIVATYKREELLFACLRRIRALEREIEVHVFPDRGTFYDPAFREAVRDADVVSHLVPQHNWYGGTSNTMNALLWAWNAGFERVFYIEDDVFVGPQFFTWHRKVQNDQPQLFSSSAWIFNRFAPIEESLLFQPWLVPIGICFSREKLELIVRHASPLYYGNMQEYVRIHFPSPTLDTLGHNEYDGLMQRILEHDGSQTVCPGIAKCAHMGFTRSYGHVDTRDHYTEILGTGSFGERVARLESFASDAHWRAAKFGKEIVGREIGREL